MKAARNIKTLNKQDYILISKWLVFWLSVLGFYLLVLTKNEITYLSSSLLISSYYLSFSLLGIKFFSNTYEFKKIIFLCLLVIFGVLTGVLLDQFLKPLTSLQIASFYEYNFYYSMLEIRSSFSKLFEVLFQQVMIFILVSYLYRRFKNTWKAISTFSIVFVILHIPLLFIFSYIGLLFVIPSVFAGYTFSYLILRYKYGYLYSYLVHLSFYLVMAIFTRQSGLSVYDLAL